MTMGEDHGRPEVWVGEVPAERLTTERLLLRCWHPGDAPLLDAALEVSWDDLQRWIPWVFPERETLAELEERLRGYREDFLEGRNALYAIMDPGESEVLGGAGLYRRIGAGALEIGYWVRSDVAGRGIATEAAAKLTEVGLSLPDVDRIEIHCEPAHEASAAIPRKLGYVHAETVGTCSAPGAGDRETMVWVKEAGAAGEEDG